MSSGRAQDAPERPERGDPDRQGSDDAADRRRRPAAAEDPGFEPGPGEQIMPREKPERAGSQG